MASAGVVVTAQVVDSGDLLNRTLGSAGGLLPLHAARPREALGNQHGHLPYRGWSDLDDATWVAAKHERLQALTDNHVQGKGGALS